MLFRSREKPKIMKRKMMPFDLSQGREAPVSHKRESSTARRIYFLLFLKIIFYIKINEIFAWDIFIE